MAGQSSDFSRQPTLFGSLCSDEAGNQCAENVCCTFWGQENEDNEDNDETPIFFEVKFGVEVMQADQDIPRSEILSANKRKLCASSDSSAKRTNSAM